MNFISTFEELNKLYEEKELAKEEVPAEAEQEVAVESCNGSEKPLTEAADEDVVEDEEAPVEEAPVEEPVEDKEEPRQVILQCDKCGALVIKDEADVVVDEKTDLVNVEDECAFCEEAEGYKIMGVVAPYEVDEDEEVAEDEAAVEEPVEDPAEGEAEIEDELMDEDLGDWYRKKFDKPASVKTQMKWEDELNGEYGEISPERRKELEKKFAQQRDWEARHPEKEELDELLDADINLSLDGGEGNAVDVL
jgi:hypothetical protein